jgi:hypothetical protein
MITLPPGIARRQVADRREPNARARAILADYGFEAQPPAPRPTAMTSPFTSTPLGSIFGSSGTLGR